MLHVVSDHVPSREVAMLQLLESFVQANVARVMTLTTAMMRATAIPLRAMFLGQVFWGFTRVLPLFLGFFKICPKVLSTK